MNYLSASRRHSIRRTNSSASAQSRMRRTKGVGHIWGIRLQTPGSPSRFPGQSHYVRTRTILGGRETFWEGPVIGRMSVGAGLTGFGSLVLHRGLCLNAIPYSLLAMREHAVLYLLPPAPVVVVFAQRDVQRRASKVGE